MGKTSPNNKIKKVTKITSTANFKIEDVMVEKTSSREKENKITIAMCKKLFATKIVANNFFGFDSNRLIILALYVDEIDNSLRFWGDSEKSATSDAATIAQQNSNTIIPITPKSNVVFMVENKFKLGSGSKLLNLVKQY